MKRYALRDQFRCVLLGPADWKIIRDASTATVEESGNDDDRKVHKEVEPSTWKLIVSSQESKHFVLFHGRKTLVGTGQLDIEKNLIRGDDVYIFKKYRGKKLTDLIYAAWFNYIAKHGLQREMVINIQDTNKASIGAAQRNGFRKAEKQPEHDFKIYKRDLSNWEFHLDV